MANPAQRTIALDNDGFMTGMLIHAATMKTSMVLDQPIATAEEMRAADAATIAGGVPGDELMDRAGRAVARAIVEFVGPDDVLILCGPGNNGGDGYVIARELAAKNWPITVAQSAPPNSAEAISAAARYEGTVCNLADAKPARIVVDALFGTGLRRPLDTKLAKRLETLMAAASTSIAVDLPSGVGTDDGALLGASRAFDMTVALGALKPAHLLYPAASLCGRLVVADIGISVTTDCALIGPLGISPPGFADHKYTRGFVFVIGGAMPGAALLSARAAQAAGAGYVVLAGEGAGQHEPASIIQRQAGSAELEDLVGDERIGALVVGPGLGRDREASLRLDAALSRKHPLVLDADALVLLGGSAVPIERRLHGCTVVLTPHEGEFTRLFGALPGSRIDRARAAARQSGATIVLKGPDTVVAAPDGRTAVAAGASFWLATAGTGDVLAGVIGTMLTRGSDPFAAACAGVWLHGEAARRAGAAFNADALVRQIRSALGETSRT